MKLIKRPMNLAQGGELSEKTKRMYAKRRYYLDTAEEIERARLFHQRDTQTKEFMRSLRNG